MEAKHMNFEVRSSKDAYEIWNAGERIATINNAIIGQKGAANLLAASPDLLHALKEILESPEMTDENLTGIGHAAMKQAEFAIAKAETRESSPTDGPDGKIWTEPPEQA